MQFVYSFSLVPILFLIGFLLLADIRKGLHGISLVCMSLPLGAVVWCISSLILLVIGLELRFYSILILSCLIVIGIFIQTYGFGGVLSKYRSWLFNSITFYLMLSVFSIILILPFVDFILLTGDSFHMIYIAHSILNEGSLTESIKQTYIWAYPLIIPLTSSASELKEFSSFPLFSISNSIFMIIFVGLFSYSLFNKSGKKNLSIFLAFSCVLLAVSPEIMIFNLFYLNNHILVASFFLLLSYLVRFRSDMSGEQIIRLFIIALIGISISRIEGFLVTFITYLYFSKYLLKTRTERFKVVVYLFLFELLYLGFLAFNGGEYRGTIIKFWHIIASIISYLILVLVTFYEDKLAGFSNLRRNMVYYMFAGFFILLVVGFILRGEHMSTSLMHFIQNAFMEEGHWGVGWWLILLMSVFVFSVNKWGGAVEYGFSIIYILFICSLAVFHFMPYRIGFADSANRMLVHIYPFTVIFLINALFRIKERYAFGSISNSYEDKK